MVPSACVAANNQFIFETVGAFHEVVQMHVPELMYFATFVVGADKTHLSDKNLGFKKIGVFVEAFGIGVSRVRYKWSPNFARDFNTLELQITDLRAGKPQEFFLELHFLFPNHKAKGRQRVGCFKRGYHVIARERDFLTSFHPAQVAYHPSTVQTLDHKQKAAQVIDGIGGCINNRWFHLHHAASRNVLR